MPRGNLLVGFGLGLLSGLLGAVVFLGGQAPRAFAQAPPAPAHRFAISAWAQSGSQGVSPSNGAYLLDTESGKVWSIVGNQKPVAIGRAE